MTEILASAPDGGSRRVRSYGAFAWCYDAIARVASAGAIERSKLCRVDDVEPGDRIAVVGAGSGSDAVALAEAGARVTALDVSERMLERLERRAGRSGQKLAMRRESLFDHRPPSPYDAVFVPYLLNVFDASEAREAIGRSIGWLRPGGRLVIADFAPARASGSLPGRLWLRTYYAAIDGLGALLGLAPLHSIHDYAGWLDPLGARLVDRRTFAIWPGGPAQFESLVAVVGDDGAGRSLSAPSAASSG